MPGVVLDSAWNGLSSITFRCLCDGGNDLRCVPPGFRERADRCNLACHVVTTEVPPHDVQKLCFLQYTIRSSEGGQPSDRVRLNGTHLAKQLLLKILKGREWNVPEFLVNSVNVRDNTPFSELKEVLLTEWDDSTIMKVRHHLFEGELEAVSGGPGYQNILGEPGVGEHQCVISIAEDGVLSAAPPKYTGCLETVSAPGEEVARVAHGNMGREASVGSGFSK